MRATLSLFFLTTLGVSAIAVWGFLAGVLLRDFGVAGLPALAPAILAVYLAVAGKRTGARRGRARAAL
jgi:uncharacterized membrane protein